MSVWHPHAKHLHSEDLRMDLFATVTIQFLHFILLLHVSKICLSLCRVRRGSTVPAGIAMGGRVRPDMSSGINEGGDPEERTQRSAQQAAAIRILMAKHWLRDLPLSHSADMARILDMVGTYNDLHAGVFAGFGVRPACRSSFPEELPRMGAVTNLVMEQLEKRHHLPRFLTQPTDRKIDSAACQFGAGCLQRSWQRRARQATFHSSTLEIHYDFVHEWDLSHSIQAVRGSRRTQWQRFDELSWKLAWKFISVVAGARQGQSSSWLQRW